MAFPTETVYGLGAAAERPTALARLFHAKGRPRSHPVIVHGADASLLERYSVGPGRDARALADAFWPGPLTLVVPRSRHVPDEVTGGQDTVGLRVPDHPIALALIAGFGGGVAAPSANRFGRVSPTSAEAVRAELGERVEVVLDGGAPTIGIESTVLDLSGGEPTILRPGAVSSSQLARALERPVGRVARDAGPRAPGRLAVHYSPDASVELVSADGLATRAAELTSAGGRVAVLSPEPVSVDRAVLVIDGLGHGTGYARELYAALRQSDHLAVDVVLAVPPTGTDIAEAIVDRLRRATGGA